MGEKMILIILVSICCLAMGNWSILDYRKKIMDMDSSGLKRYCESWRMNVELNNIKEFNVVPDECTSYIGKYMTSSQYICDSETAIEECQLYLSSFCSVDEDGKDAWIFDIDDTLLSTVPYFQKHNFGGQMFNSTSLEAWMQEEKAPALEHTLKFYHTIRQRGYKIFLISTRRERLRDATVDNLVMVGYHGWTALFLRGLDDEQESIKSYKAETRKKLVNEGYRIWGILGDQWSSFEGSPSAKRTFKLPNSMYYVS